MPALSAEFDAYDAEHAARDRRALCDIEEVRQRDEISSAKRSGAGPFQTLMHVRTVRVRHPLPARTADHPTAASAQAHERP
jgi:hypothetical protein